VDIKIQKEATADPMKSHHETERTAATRWLWIAVGVLLVAGAFALLLVLARMPPFDALVTDPGFFRRCLVVHVQLSIVCWFYAFVCALLHTLPPGRLAPQLTSWGPRLGFGGVLLLCASAFVPGGQPIMSNYVPMVDHPLGAMGLALFGIGVLTTVLSRQVLPRGGAAAVPGFHWPGAHAAAPALRTAALALLLAATTLIGTMPSLPEGVAPEVTYEVLFWGMGHVLQVASVAAMLGVWLWAVHGATGRAAMSRRAASVAFALLLLPWLAAPLLTAAGAWSATYRVGFTRLMQFGLAPVVLWVLFACVRTLFVTRRQRAGNRIDGRVLGFWVSAGLTLLGFGLGASIRDANTVIPAHYHANIGAVTAAFMMASFALLPALGLPQLTGRTLRLSRWQPVLFGAGQTVFAVGFGLAGSQGMARKVYGQEQAVRSGLETFGLSVMGIGGFVAIAAGVLFLVIHVRAFVGARALVRAVHVVPGGSNA
jgi:hypothetical protein